MKKTFERLIAAKIALQTLAIQLKSLPTVKEVNRSLMQFFIPQIHHAALMFPESRKPHIFRIKGRL